MSQQACQNHAKGWSGHKAYPERYFIFILSIKWVQGFSPTADCLVRGGGWKRVHGSYVERVWDEDVG